MKSICVFCGSSAGAQPEYMTAARNLGKNLAANKINLVYGGASVGLMGAVADEVLAHGGHVIGVIPKILMTKEVAHHGLTDLRIVDSMHSRKALMAELSDGFIALPGGFGTFEELCEIVTWSQLGLHQKPIGVLDVLDYYKPLKELVNKGIEEKFIREQYKDLVVFANSSEELLQKFSTYQPLDVPKWIRSPSQT
ncbi:TIGR00730 family Rossman fold protein [Bdellovibrio sp. HCB-162]|uniref:LOG family protein n=1 Tax=Bdellovibrio sp. HCB-162 TaxID=3394234 RepID=UPI0039BC817D